MPVQFAVAPGGEPHVDTRDVSGRRKLALDYFVSPATLLYAPFHQVKRIPDGNYVTEICRRRCVGIWILAKQSFVFRSPVTR
jgi:hypothetical protein